MSIQAKFVEHMVCEIGRLKKGEISCANRMLMERVEAMDRYDAMVCLMEKDDAQYSDIISYIYEQVKEMTTKLILTI